MAESGDGDTTVEVERVFRDVAGQAVATLVRNFGDIDLAEDAVQDAFVAASRRWPTEGIPANPAGWIVTTARNRAIDQLRRATRGRVLTRLADGRDDHAPAHLDHQDLDHQDLDHQDLDHQDLDHQDLDHHGDHGYDDRLRLIFTCCHPSLRPEHQVALTLRLLGGLSVETISAAFLVNEATMSKRLVRAKYKIKAANIPYRVPDRPELAARLRSVLSVLYLIYNAGTNDLAEQGALRSEAIRLARGVATLLPDEPEAAGLLALLLLNESRVPARRADNEVVLLRDHDRSAWDRSLIEEGHAIVRSCIRVDRPGPFQLQAAIQAVHCDAVTFEATDWRQIVALYDHLLALTPTPIVSLNRAIAVGEIDGPEVALALLDEVAPQLDGYCPLHAARATMLRRLERRVDARTAFDKAAGCATADSERRHFERQIAELRDDHRP